MAYNNLHKNGENLDRHLKIDDRLDSHLKPIKIGEDQTGLQLGGKDVRVEGNLNVEGNIVAATDDGSTPVANAQLANKQYVDEMKQTAVWGGTYPRASAHDEEWLGIPTGHQTSVCIFGVDEAGAEAVYDPDTADTADDLCGVIWQPLHYIKIINCRIYYAQGGGTNTRHLVCLMRYDIDVDGVLTAGVEVGGIDADVGSDDSATLAFKDLTITSDVDVTSSQVLIGMVYAKDGINAAFSTKCILEYQETTT